MTGTNAMTAASLGAPVPGAAGGKLGMALSAAQGLASIAGGFMGQSSYNKEAEMLRQQGDLALAEARRTAEQKAREVTEFQAAQGHRYVTSGVTIEGSPALVLERTRKLGQEEVDALIRQGEAQKRLAYMQADITRNKGRASMFAGVVKGLTPIAESALSTKFNFGGGPKTSPLASAPLEFTPPSRYRQTGAIPYYADYNLPTVYSDPYWTVSPKKYMGGNG